MHAPRRGWSSFGLFMSEINSIKTMYSEWVLCCQPITDADSSKLQLVSASTYKRNRRERRRKWVVGHTQQRLTHEMKSLIGPATTKTTTTSDMQFVAYLFASAQCVWVGGATRTSRKWNYICIHLGGMYLCCAIWKMLFRSSFFENL